MHKFKIKIINRINSHKYPVFIFIIISLIVPFLWFYNNNGTFLSHGHSGLLGALYNPHYILKFAPYLITLHDAGGPSVEYYIFYPFATIFSFIIDSFGHNYMYAEMFFLGITIFFSLIFFYLFVIELFENDNDKKLISFISAIFYIFNIFTIFYLRYFGNSQAILYIFPLTSSVLYFFIKGLKTKKFHYSFIVALIVSLFVIILMLPQFYLPGLLFLILFFFIYKILNNKKISGIKNDVVYVLKMFFTVLFVNMWWLINYLTNFFATYKGVKKISVSFMKAVFQKNPFITAGDLLSYLRNETFINNLNFYPKYLHVKHENIYFTPYFILIGFFITFIALIPIFKNPKKYYMFIFLYLFGLYLSIGYAFPFQKLKFWFLKNLPFNLIFQSNSVFLIIIIVSESILLGIGSIIIYEFVKNKFGNKLSIILLSSIIFISCIIYPFPLWYPNTIVGDMHIDYKDKKITTQVKIPYYYNYAKKFLDKTRINYNIILLPLFFPNANFNWHYGYIGGMYFGLLYGHNVIVTPNLQYPQSIILVSMQNYGYPDLQILLGMLSTRYVILQNDIILPKKNIIGNPLYAGLYHYLKYLSKRNLHSILNTSKGVKLVKRYGKLDIYKLSDQYFIPRVWTPKRLIFVNNKLKLRDLDNSVIPITLQNSFKVRTAIFAKLSSQNKQSEKIKNNEINNIVYKYLIQYLLTKKIIDIFSSKNRILNIVETRKKLYTPTIEFKEINPSKYVVIVHNAKISFPLIFNLMYLKGWNVYPQVYPQNTDDKYSKDDYNKTENILKIANKNITFNGNQFISRNINGTIQNNNIPDGHIFQTLFGKPLSSKYHFVANGYANSWWINLNYIKKLGPRYYKVNKNGTIDFEMIIDYWPQRLFYIGIIISGATVLLCVLYLIYDWKKKRVKKF